ncbi:hypothetical protein M1563_02110 [Patescibacteria group bacterium]|nr:hypothetical protein [Patescibacteria group bacterium]
MHICIIGALWFTTRYIFSILEKFLEGGLLKQTGIESVAILYMACEVLNHQDQIQDVLDFRHSRLVLPARVFNAFQIASATTEGEFFLIGSGARRCLMDDADSIKELDFIGDFDLDKVQQQYRREFIRKWDQYRSLKISWDGIEIDFIARKDIISALRGSDITLSLMCIDKDGKVYDPLGVYEDFEKKQIKIDDADEKIQVSPERILRVVRFSADLGYQIEDSTLQACRSNAHLMTPDNTEYALNQFILSKPSIRDRAIQLAEEHGLIGNLRRVVEEKSEADLIRNQEFNTNRDHLEQLLGLSSFYVFGGTIRDVLLGKPIKDFDIKVENNVVDFDQVAKILSARGFRETDDVRTQQGSYYINPRFHVISFRIDGILFDLSFTDSFDIEKWRKECDINLNAMVFDNESGLLLNRDLSFEVVMRHLALCDPYAQNIDPLKVVNALKQMARIDNLTVEGQSLNVIKASMPALLEYFQANPNMRYKLNSVLGHQFTDKVEDLIKSCTGGTALLQLLER